VIPRREGDDARFPFLRRQLQEAVRSAPQLECASRLQALALEPDTRAIDLALQERRSLNETRDPLGCFSDVAAGDLDGFC